MVPVTALYSIGHLVSWLGKTLPSPETTQLWPHPFKPWETILFYSIYGVPTAYIVLILIGLPCYLLARKFNLVSYKVAVFAAVIASIPAAVFYGSGSHFWQMLGFLLLFGIPISLVFIRLMKQTTKKVNQ